MLKFDISLLPFIVVTLANFFLSWLWYSPVLFMKPWAKALGFDPNHEMSEEEKKAMPFLFLSALVSSMLLAYGLQVVVHSVGVADFSGGLLVGVVAWAAFSLPYSLNTLFEGRKGVVLLINNGLLLLTYAVFGGVTAVWL